MYPPSLLCQTLKPIIIIQRDHSLTIYATDGPPLLDSCRIPFMQVDLNDKDNYYEWAPFDGDPTRQR